MYDKPEHRCFGHVAQHEKEVSPSAEGHRRLWSLAAQYGDGLPAMPHSVFRLNDLLSHSVLDLSAVVRVLSRDVSISAQVIRLAHTFSGEDDDSPYRLEDCVVLLGASKLRNLVLTAALAPTDHSTTVRLDALSQHCSLTATFGGRIAEACGHPEPRKAHVAGLLHDLGELPACVATAQSTHPCDIAEFDHCSVGGWLARFWNLPAFLVDVIEHHHDPGSACRDPFLVKIVAAADEACRACGVGVCMEPSARVEDDCIAVLNRHLAWLSEPRRVALAQALKTEFLSWVKFPV